MTAIAGPSPWRGGWDFVGRDREVAELVAGLEDALGGQGRRFLISVREAGRIAEGIPSGVDLGAHPVPAAPEGVVAAVPATSRIHPPCRGIAGGQATR